MVLAADCEDHVHLAGTGFRAAPWSPSAVVVGGLLLHGFVSGFPDKVLSAVPTDIAYWSAHFKTYMFVASDGTLIAHIMLSMFIGSLVALTAKGREMVATMTLSLILGTMTGMVYVASIAPALGCGRHAVVDAGTTRRSIRHCG